MQVRTAACTMHACRAWCVSWNRRAKYRRRGGCCCSVAQDGVQERSQTAMLPLESFFKVCTVEPVALAHRPGMHVDLLLPSCLSSSSSLRGGRRLGAACSYLLRPVHGKAVVITRRAWFDRGTDFSRLRRASHSPGLPQHSKAYGAVGRLGGSQDLPPALQAYLQPSAQAAALLSLTPSALLMCYRHSYGQVRR